MVNYYHLLSLGATASQPDIQRKYQELRRDGSPDGANIDWELVDRAYAVLRNQERRREYDARLLRDNERPVVAHEDREAAAAAGSGEAEETAITVEAQKSGSDHGSDGFDSLFDEPTTAGDTRQAAPAAASVLAAAITTARLINSQAERAEAERARVRMEEGIDSRLGVKKRRRRSR
ncbi:MAG: hypothetical protein Q9184_006530 [Pyrenodesmia sp. 2 TL-2023]